MVDKTYYCNTCNYKMIVSPGITDPKGISLKCPNLELPEHIKAAAEGKKVILSSPINLHTCQEEGEMELIRYDAAESVDDLIDAIDDFNPVQSLKELEAFKQPGDKVFKLTIKIEEI